MRYLVYLFVSFILISCTTTIQPKEDTAPSDSSRVKITVGEKTKPESKLLLKASFTEPFMYSEIYTNKAIFVLPKEDTLILIHDFDSLALSKDFTFSGVQNSISFKLQLVHKSCIHAGSGEKWSIQANFEINEVQYQGCGNLNR